MMSLTAATILARASEAGRDGFLCKTPLTTTVQRFVCENKTEYKQSLSKELLRWLNSVHAQLDESL